MLSTKRSYDLHQCHNPAILLETSSESEEDPMESTQRSQKAGRRFSTAQRIQETEKECIKEGYLLKQEGSFQGWRRRFFKLYPRQLFYAKCANANLFHQIDLADISVAEASINNVNNSFKIIAYPCTLVLCAENRRSMEEWISSLKAAVRKMESPRYELTDRLSGDHHWYSCNHTRLTFCNVCGDLLPGMTGRGLACEVCRFKSHKQCASRAPRNCKWTTIESIPPEIRLPGTVDDVLAMPHEWLEGNVSPNSRCAVCEKSCGSKRQLQDMTCLWCNHVVHNACLSNFPVRCTLGLNNLSTIPPTALRRAEHMGPGYWEVIYHTKRSPLLVFVNSKSGDNQGIRFMRRFRQLLNPAQVFDLSVAGPSPGLRMCRNFEYFRILVCGGDGSVGWVMTEVDNQGLNKKCQIGVLPLGTGNDLARVLGWGSACYDVRVIPLVLQQLERARPEMLDRWSILIKEFPSEAPEGEAINAYEDSVVMHLTRMVNSNQYDIVIKSAKFLCETVKDFVSKVGAMSASSNPEEVLDPDSLTEKCSKLQQKLSSLLRTLQIESQAISESVTHSDDGSLRRKSIDLDYKEHIEVLESTRSNRWHSDSDLQSEEPHREKLPAKKSKQKVFIEKEHLWSRANSLKKAMREIIDHTAEAVDKQNAQVDIDSNQYREELGLPPSTSSSLEPSNERLNQSQGEFLDDCFSLPLLDVTEKDRGTEKRSESTTSQSNEGGFYLSPDSSVGSSLPDRRRSMSQSSPSRCVSKGTGGTYHLLRTDGLLGKQRQLNTVAYPGTVIAKAFLKEQITESLISKVLLANANALCAAVVPELDEQDNLNGYSEKCVMNNYFGIGIDAKISLDFHNKREEHPEQCRSRKKNIIWYGVLGGKEFLNRTYRNLDKSVHLECDGHKISLPSLQGIVILNIPSYMGGANFWGTRKEVDDFTSPSFDDRMLEVVAVLGASQMGMSKVFGGMQHHRIAQCHNVKITITDEAVPVQVDGEAWMQRPGIIHISHKNRSPMLIRDREFEVTLRSWNELQQDKSERLSEPLSEQEMDLLCNLTLSLVSLIRSVKAASMMCSVVQQELYQSSLSLATIIERISKDGSVNKAVGRELVMDFVSQSKAFIGEVNEKLWTLKPELSQELETRIASALSKADAEMSKYLEQSSALLLKAEDDTESVRGLDRPGSMRQKLNFFSRKAFSTRERARRDRLTDGPYCKSVLDWGVEEVGMWLESIGCHEYRGIFQQHDIRGPELVALDRPDLQQLGVTKVGHVKRILEKIKQLEKSKPQKAGKWSRKTVS